MPFDEPAVEAHEGDRIVENLFRDRSWSALVGAAEALLGLIVNGFFFIVGIVFFGSAALFNAWAAGYPRLERGVLITLTALWLPAVVLEWRSLLVLVDGLQTAEHPIGLSIATRQRDRPSFFRVILGFWWLAHAAAVVFVAHVFVAQVTFQNPTPVERAIEKSAQLVFRFGAAFACNTHLLIGLFALTRSERLVRFVWRVRVLLDLAVTFLVPTVDWRLLSPH